MYPFRATDAALKKASVLVCLFIVSGCHCRLVFLRERENSLLFRLCLHARITVCLLPLPVLAINTITDDNAFSSHSVPHSLDLRKSMVSLQSCTMATVTRLRAGGTWLRSKLCGHRHGRRGSSSSGGPASPGRQMSIVSNTAVTAVDFESLWLTILSHVGSTDRFPPRGYYVGIGC